MEFQVYSTRAGYDIEKCTENYLEIFKKVGISYRRENNISTGNEDYMWHYGATIITLNSLDELMRLIKELSWSVIVNDDEEFPEIEIYDDYRE